MLVPPPTPHQDVARLVYIHYKVQNYTAAQWFTLYSITKPTVSRIIYVVALV